MFRTCFWSNELRLSGVQMKSREVFSVGFSTTYPHSCKAEKVYTTLMSSCTWFLGPSKASELLVLWGWKRRPLGKRHEASAESSLLIFLCCYLAGVIFVLMAGHRRIALLSFLGGTPYKLQFVVKLPAELADVWEENGPTNIMNHLKN